MNRDDIDLIYSYLNGSLNDYQIQKFEEKMRDGEFSAEFVNFVTDEENVIYEDKDGAIFISADKKGIYKIEFTDFR